jgi:hypothetical protein
MHALLDLDGSTMLLGIHNAPYRTLGGRLKLVVSW